MTFDIVAERALAHVRGTGTVLRHRQSGAQVLAVQNADPEQVFGVIVETLPQASNGVAHLLEHLIFRGSRRYPETHIYAKLVQGSRLTGLNASTGADSTLFHFSTADPADFSNLVDVMMDAVFHPLLRKPDFFQERDVIVNEMLGHHAVPANQIVEKLRQALLPGSVYATDHGGDPRMITDLQHDDLRDFHARHYQPANARFFLWGNVDLAQRLDQLDPLLGSALSPQVSDRITPPRLDKPRHLSAPYPAGPDSPVMTGLGWAFTAENPDLWQTMALALLADPDGPIRQAVHGHAGRLIGPGFGADKPLETFEIAFLGHEKHAAPVLTDAIEQALRKLPQDPNLGRWMRRAAAQFEFHLRSFGQHSLGPTGLKALNMIRGAWHHAADPLGLLDSDARAARLHHAVTTEPQTILRQLTDDLLNNPCHVVLSMYPDSLPQPANSGQPRPKTAPDPAATIAPVALPFVALRNPVKDHAAIAVETQGHLLQLTNLNPDLARAELALSLSGLCAAQLDLVPMFELLLPGQVALAGMEITTRCWAAPIPGQAGGAWVSVSARSLPARGPQMLEHLWEVVTKPLPALAVIQGRITAARNALQAQLAAFGHVLCETRLRAHASAAGALNERLAGLYRLGAYEQALARAPEDLAQDLNRLRSHLCERAQITLAVCAITTSAAQKIIPFRPGMTPVAAPLDLPHSEGIPTGSANFTTGQAVRLTDVGAAHVAAHMLETGWLWDSIRVGGGAYSVRCGYNADDGLMTLMSIRDPSPRWTLDQIAQAPTWLIAAAQGDLLARCITAKMGQLTRPVRPDLALATALRRHLGGQTDAARHAELQRVQRLDAKAMRACAQQLEMSLAQARTVVLGPQDGLEDLTLGGSGQIGLR